MIDEKKLAEYRLIWDAIGDPVFKDIADTLEALWKVARAAEDLSYAVKTEALKKALAAFEVKP